jgi:hypothetical protein
MINVDLSKGLHERITDLFPALMPGLFFEISLVLARPQQVQDRLAPLHLERYLQIIIALVLAFIIGTAFMCLVRIIYSVLWYGYRRILWLWVKLLDYSTKKFPPRMPPAQPGRLRRFIQHAQMDAHHGNQRLRGIQQAWAKAGTRLLKVRYGINPPSAIGGADESSAWKAVLGVPKSKIYRGVMLANAAHATGWSGIAAAHLAPALRNSPYLTLSWFLIGYGVFVQLLEIKRWTSRNSVWLIALYSVLEEIPQPSASTEKKAQEQQGDVFGVSDEDAESV